MRLFICLFLLSTLSACGHRGIPPEITALHTLPSKVPAYFKPEVIIIDAGHGGKDAGASSKRYAYEEKQMTLETAFLVSDYLKKLGYKTLMTRKQDVFVPLDTRAEIANSIDADLFVSIHYNYSPSREAEGIEIFYYKEDKTNPSERIVQSKALGQEVLKKVVKNTGAESRGIKPGNLAVVRQTKMPAILVEAGFLSNPTELEKLKDPKYIQSLAKGIAHGIDQYLTNNRSRRDSNARPAA